MPDVFEFANLHEGEQTYADGTVVPHLDADVLLNGEKVGRLNAHLHRHRGRDGRTDVSFGFTAVAFTATKGS